MQARSDYPGHYFIQGLQWDAPTHGQVSMGIVGAANEPQGVSNFEYMFDSADADTSRAGESIPEVLDTTQPSPYPTMVPAQPMDKENVTAQNTLDGAAFLENDFPTESYAFVDHPSRDLNWTIGDLRALQDAAPEVVCGFEGFPGDQAAAARGGYGNYFDAARRSPTRVSGPTDPNYNEAETDLARTYGGADDMVAKVGGVWDALLGEGRPWYVYGDSEFHWWTTQYKDAGGKVVGASFDDFWPGQYDKTWTYQRTRSYDALVAAIKSGDSYIVNGDLINALDFHATSGQDLPHDGSDADRQEGPEDRRHDPLQEPRDKQQRRPRQGQPHRPHRGQRDGPHRPVEPRLHEQRHEPYGARRQDLPQDQDAPDQRVGGHDRAFKPQASMYFRLRGTNLAPNTPNQTDVGGNPLIDTLTYVTVPNPDPAKAGDVTINTPDQAWADLWLYSNPIFVHVK